MAKAELIDERTSSQELDSLKEEILSSLHKTVEGIIEVGTALLEAKKYLMLKGTFEQWTEDNLPFSLRHAQRFMKIAQDNRITTHVSLLPPSIGTLEKLTQLDDTQFNQAIYQKLITPKLTRADATKMKKGNFDLHQPRVIKRDDLAKLFVIKANKKISWDDIEEIRKGMEPLVRNLKNRFGIDISDCKFVDSYESEYEKKKSRVDILKEKIFVKLAMETIQTLFDTEMTNRGGRIKKINLKRLKRDSKNSKFIHKCGLAEVDEFLRDGVWKLLDEDSAQELITLLGGDSYVNAVTELGVEAYAQAQEKVFGC